MSSRSIRLFRRYILCFLMLSLFLPVELCPSPACAAGEPDPGFGTDGLISADVDGFSPAYSVVDTDGNIVAGGSIDNDIALIRFTSSGELDTSFGTGGVVSADFGGNGRVSSLVFDTDGNIVAGGSIDNDIALVRFTSSGELDTSFSVDGVVSVDLGGNNDNLNSLALDADGNIVAGILATNGTYFDFFLLRFTSTGDLDPSFGSDGVVSADFGGDDYLESLAFDADGNIVAGGSTTNGPGQDPILVRFTSSGELDTSFGTDGVVSADFGGTGWIVSLALDADGNIVAGGHVDNGTALARLTSRGELDTSFGTNGVVSVDFGEGLVAEMSSPLLVLDATGNIVVGGSLGDAEGYDFFLARLTSGGELDTSFGTEGIVTADFGGYDRIHSLTIDSAGDILAAGVSGSVIEGSYCVVVARYSGEDSPSGSSSGGCNVAGLPGGMALLALPLIFMRSRLGK